MKPLRILFQTHNRRGLGHLMRGMNIAKEIKILAPHADILFYSKSRSALSLCGDKYKLFIETDEKGLSHWSETVEKFSPHVIVYDTVLPKEGDEKVPGTAARQVYIMRKTKPDRQEALFAHPLMCKINQIIVPHTADEFGYVLPAELRQKTTFVGPIVRKPSQENAQLLREKYQIAADDFLLTSTVGGGGFQDRADHFFDIVFKIHLKILPRLPKLHHIVIEGPNYQKKLASLNQMTVLKSEPEMASLLSISHLVIAEGGYNTVNEIRLAKRPAIFLPSERNYDDQEERVRLLETKGLAKVFADQAPSVIAKGVEALICSKDGLKHMHKYYEIDQTPWGNRKTAEIIINEGARIKGTFYHR